MRIDSSISKQTLKGLQPIYRKDLTLPESVKPAGKAHIALCPAHDDHQHSLSIGTGEDGRVLLKCFAGCSADVILGALGLAFSDLFPEAPEERVNTTVARSKKGDNPSVLRATVQRSPESDSQAIPALPGCTLAAYAERKALPLDFLMRLGLRDQKYQSLAAVRIPYIAPDGTEVAVRYRIALEKVDGSDDRFRWQKGTKTYLYGLWRLEQARSAGYVVLTEGESDAQTLWFHNEPALGIPRAGASDHR